MRNEEENQADRRRYTESPFCQRWLMDIL